MDAGLGDRRQHQVVAEMDFASDNLVPFIQDVTDSVPFRDGTGHTVSGPDLTRYGRLK